jgi:hypothetical protein
VGFQEFERTRRAHLRRDHACNVFLQRNVVDNDKAGATFDDSQGAAKNLAFLALPMETDPDRHVLQGKRRRRDVNRRQRHFTGELISAGVVSLPGGILKYTRQFYLDGGAPFHQSDRYVHGSLSSIAATS